MQQHERVFVRMSLLPSAASGGVAAATCTAALYLHVPVIDTRHGDLRKVADVVRACRPMVVVVVCAYMCAYMCALF